MKPVTGTGFDDSKWAACCDAIFGLLTSRFFENY